LIAHGGRLQSGEAGCAARPGAQACCAPRADGRCVLCDTEGFRMGDGWLYAETRHKEARYGSQRADIETQLLELLVTMYLQHPGRQGAPAH
jgi:hypothetical protein